MRWPESTGVNVGACLPGRGREGAKGPANTSQYRAPATGAPSQKPWRETCWHAVAGRDSTSPPCCVRTNDTPNFPERGIRPHAGNTNIFFKFYGL